MNYTENEFHVIQFDKTKHETLWDDFVLNVGLFGTIYHTRRFINYHPPHRFVDASILIFFRSELVCVVPATLKMKGEEVNYFSYTGATYGGPVLSKTVYTPKYLPSLINVIFSYYNDKIEFRLANSIYFKENIHMLYWALSTRLKMVPELAWYVCTEQELQISNSFNLRMLKKMYANPLISCKITNHDDDYNAFYSILNKSLSHRHNVSPTHSLMEFMDLKIRLGEKQALYMVKQKVNCNDDNDEINKNTVILGGVFVIKATPHCWYTFYICKNPDTSNHAAIPMLMNTIRADAQQENVPYLDYGICTENGGQILNTGLGEFKMSSLGGQSSARYLFLAT